MSSTGCLTIVLVILAILLMVLGYIFLYYIGVMDLKYEQDQIKMMTRVYVDW